MNQVKDEIQRYLQKHQDVKKIQHLALTLNDNSVFRLVLLLDLYLIFDETEHLGSVIVQQPEKAVKIFQKVVQEMAPDNLTDSKIQIVLQVMSPPPFVVHELESPRNFPSPYAPRRLFKCTGILVAKSIPSKYTQSAVYRCASDNCCGAQSWYFKISNILEELPSGNDPMRLRCRDCTLGLTEESSHRVMGDRILGLLLPLADCQQNGYLQRKQAIRVRFRDELSEGLVLGCCYVVTGWPAFEKPNDNPQHAWTAVLEASSREPFPERLSLPLPFPLLYPIFQEVWNASMSSPWGFPAALAFCFGDGIALPGAFFQLKLLLLLSLVSSHASAAGTKERGESRPLSLLVETQEWELAHRLLMWALPLSPRGIRHNLSCPLVAAPMARRDADGAAGGLEAGSLLLAKGGVCYLGDLAKLKKDSCDTLYTALDTGTMTSRACAGLEDTTGSLSFPLECAIWAYCDSSSSHAKDGSIQAVKSLNDAFGLHCYVGNVEDEKENEMVDKYLSSFTLTWAICNRKNVSLKGALSPEDLQQVVAYCACREVTFQPSAKKLIQNYFVASRRFRLPQTGTRRPQFPLTALSAMSTMAASHAKVCMRSEVREEDALVAIWLYEEAVTSLTGFSCLQLHPRPHAVGINAMENLLEKHQYFMSQLQVLLNEFLHAYASDTSSLGSN